MKRINVVRRMYINEKLVKKERKKWGDYYIYVRGVKTDAVMDIPK